MLHNWIVVPTVALSIATLATCRTLAGTVLSHSWLVWGGKISYCFYSFQALVIFSLLSAGNAVPANGAIVLLVAFAALMAISAAGYHWIEEPMRLRLRRATNPAPALTTS